MVVLDFVSATDPGNLSAVRNGVEERTNITYTNRTWCDWKVGQGAGLKIHGTKDNDSPQFS